MDSIIKVRRSFLNEIRALLKAFRSVCDTCYRNPCNCYFAEEMARAKQMISRIDNVRDAEEERFFVENPIEEYLSRIVKAIQQGGGRVKSQNIVTGDSCRVKKARALKKLVTRGTIRKVEVDGVTYYEINKNFHNNTHNKERK